MSKFKNIWRPANFQGNLNKKEYFEGWYFKLVDEAEEKFLALIPGVSIKEDGSSHSFIQVNDGNTNKAYYIKYDIEDFSYRDDEFYVQIGKNIFSKEKVILDIDDSELKLKGELEFKNNVEWPVKFFSPGAMGYNRFLPFMECYHGVVSMNHDIRGKLIKNSKDINFSGGLGYIEKDWGTSFPKTWIWSQSNHFDESNTSVFLSIANIPMLGFEFNGFIIGLLYNDKLYRFATYTGAKIDKLQYNKDDVFVSIKDSNYILDIKIIKHNTTELISPKNGDMIGTVEESLTSSIDVKLKDKSDNIIFSGRGRNAGFEIKGNLLQA